MSQEQMPLIAEARITSPEDLTALLRKIKEQLANGSLRQVTPAISTFAVSDIRTVSDQAPWPDYLEAYFEDKQGARYKLAVETYHGAGGSWERV